MKPHKSVQIIKADASSSKLLKLPGHLNPAILAMAPREPQVRKASNSASAKSVKRKSETPRFQWTLLSMSRSTWLQRAGSHESVVDLFCRLPPSTLDYPRLMLQRLQRPTFSESSKSSVKNEPQFKQQLKPTRLHCGTRRATNACPNAAHLPQIKPK